VHDQITAAVGGVVLARRRGGIGEDEAEVFIALDVPRPQGTGTMAEGVGSALPGPATNGHDALAGQRESVGPRA